MYLAVSICFQTAALMLSHRLHSATVALPLPSAQQNAQRLKQGKGKTCEERKLNFSELTNLKFRGHVADIIQHVFKRHM
jgi:BarA-like signal transduction histidine kinase